MFLFAFIVFQYVICFYVLISVVCFLLALLSPQEEADHYEDPHILCEMFISRDSQILNTRNEKRQASTTPPKVYNARGAILPN